MLGDCEEGKGAATRSGASRGCAVSFECFFVAEGVNLQRMPRSKRSFACGTLFCTYQRWSPGTPPLRRILNPNFARQILHVIIRERVRGWTHDVVQLLKW